MAARKQPYAFLLLALSTLSFIINSSNAADCVGSGAISVYWGQHTEEGTLDSACESGNYSIVILDQLIVYDDGSDPTLNFAGHYEEYETSIKHCQELGVKVFLSIGLDVTTGSTPKYENVTEFVAEYILEKFLTGQQGPLGSVSLDGIDIADIAESEHIHWDELVKIIKGFTTDKKIYLSAAPQCVYPDYYLDKAIQTGLLDYIWVEFFYQNPCIYSNGNAKNLLEAWATWTSSVSNSTIFLGLTADDGTVGYITPDELKSDVLPTAKQASNYGGVMIRDRYFDIKNDYTAQIKDSVPKSCRCVCDEAASTNFYGLKARSFSV